MKQILLAEDDLEITRLLNLHLGSPDYKLTVCHTGTEAYCHGSSGSFQLLLLDIALPGMNGLEVCRGLRKMNMGVPIIMLTAHTEEADKVLALELGADDYITKPFGVLELQARIKALLRRADAAKEPALPLAAETIAYKGLHIDKSKTKASIRNERLELTAKEFDLLYLLASHPGKSFTRQQLLELVWGVAFAGYEHTITSHINRLRTKIEANVNQPEYILTTWGRGYRFAE